MTPEQQIIEHYSKYDEAGRLGRDIGPLEAARVQELIQRYLPSAPAVVLDVGGAAGAYSFWLAGLGYAVHLVDLVPRHIEQAAQAASRRGTPALASLRVGDARHLDFEDGEVDAVVMHGPLYHLVERGDRIQALAEARRVLRSGGVLLAFGIARYAGLIYGLTRGHVLDPAYHRMIRHEVQTGQRMDPPSWAGTFPNAYFHLPQELAAEAQGVGLAVEATLGVQGPSWLVPNLDQAWREPSHREVLLDIARLVENEPVLSPQIMAVARK